MFLFIRILLFVYQVVGSFLLALEFFVRYGSVQSKVFLGIKIKLLQGGILRSRLVYRRLTLKKYSE